ncbi:MULTISPECIES: hypothetical protein [Rhizobium]|uniref:hypothetical protein n=1 Tax=Rhizobium TaxID=379 RepID=UPI001B33DDBA|nr:MULTISPECIES: hypothetical protein [Rhizobium]MBX4910324.1 hypothetical protein [Rhizobium bangladeshense]MBX5231849.1 hypothetical protein [Rhizobium sp. NLR4a]MBX5259455.1 hypothetical protein [Rhizobium sp. NLR16b]MBX5265547.1 hypothetical protein [Rhizobium sp. NLR16a]MBX5269980.1 hypothetical protein [Rhizobium sp. NLR17b]
MKKTPETVIAGIETEIANLVGRRGEILDRHTSAGAKLEKARIDRRENLGRSGDIDTASVEIRDLKNSVSDLSDLVEDLDLQISTATERLAFERHKHDRLKRAQELEKIGITTTKFAHDIDSAVSALAKTVTALRAVLPEDIKLWPAHNATRPPGSVDAGRATASPREVVAGVVADALAKAVPDLFDTSMDLYGYRCALSRITAMGVRKDWVSDTRTSPLSAVEAAELLISRPLKELAENLASEAMPGGAEIIRLPDAPFSDSRPPEEEAFVVKPLSFISSPSGPAQIIGRGRAHFLPKPVVDRAVEEGLAFRMSSPEGVAAAEEERRRRELIRGYGDPSVRHEDCVALGDVMGLRTHADEMAEVDRVIG